MILCFSSHMSSLKLYTYTPQIFLDNPSDTMYHWKGVDELTLQYCAQI